MFVSVALSVVLVGLGVSFQKAYRMTWVLCTRRRTWLDRGSTVRVPRVAALFGLKALLTIDAAGFWYRDRS